MMFDFKDWKFWVVLIAVVLSYFLMQANNTKPPVVEKEFVLQEVEARQQVIVIVYAVNEQDARNIVEKRYPEYYIKELYYDDKKQRFVIRLERKE